MILGWNSGILVKSNVRRFITEILINTVIRSRKISYTYICLNSVSVTVGQLMIWMKLIEGFGIKI